MLQGFAMGNIQERESDRWSETRLHSPCPHEAEHCRDSSWLVGEEDRWLAAFVQHISDGEHSLEEGEAGHGCHQHEYAEQEPRYPA